MPQQVRLNNTEQTYRFSFNELPHQTTFSTHLSEDFLGQKTYWVANKVLFFPWKKTMHCLARVIQPFPGKNKKGKEVTLIARISYLVLFFLLVPFALCSLAIGAAPHIYGHRKRPFLSVIDNADRIPPQSFERNQLDMRSYNLGLTYESTTIVGDLRSSVERAREVGLHILREERSPDIIGFQEGFHINATRQLCTPIQEIYPYIIHSVDPHFLGLNSGFVFASRYPIEEVFVRRFKNLIGPERLSTRGLFGVRIKLGENQFANVYNTHLQAVLGRERGRIRFQQLQQIVQWIDEDDRLDQEREGGRRTKVADFLMGDFNLAPIDRRGRYNRAEEGTLHFLQEHFVDAFAAEHNVITGERERGEPIFLDRQRFEEPTGTSYQGPAANFLVFRIKEYLERLFRSFQPGERIKDSSAGSLWGTPSWNQGQREAHLERYDYQLVRRRPGSLNTLEGVAEIEQIDTDAQSAPSDHLPIRAVYTWA